MVFLLQLQQKTWSSLLLCLFLFQLQQKSMVFSAYSCSSFSKKHCLLCLFFHNSSKACYSWLILVPTTAKSMAFFAYSYSSNCKKHGLLCLFLFQILQQSMVFFPYLVPTTSKCMVLVPTTAKMLGFLCLFLFQGAAVNHGFLLQGRRIPTTYLLPLTWLLGLLLVLPYLKFIDYFSLEVSIIDYMLPRYGTCFKRERVTKFSVLDCKGFQPFQIVLSLQRYSYSCLLFID